MAITQTYTADEVFELALTEPFELINGELHIVPGSGHRPSVIGSLILIELGIYLKTHPIGVVSGEGGGFTISHDPDTVVFPDVGFIRTSRLVNQEVPDTFNPSFPDFAVEVNSRTDRDIDAERKVQRYLKAGTTLVWLVDPKSKTVTVYRVGDAPKRYAQGQVLSGADLFPGFEVSLDLIFQLPGT